MDFINLESAVNKAAAIAFRRAKILGIIARLNPLYCGVQKPGLERQFNQLNEGCVRETGFLKSLLFKGGVFVKETRFLNGASDRNRHSFLEETGFLTDFKKPGF